MAKRKRKAFGSSDARHTISARDALVDANLSAGTASRYARGGTECRYAVDNLLQASFERGMAHAHTVSGGSEPAIATSANKLYSAAVKDVVRACVIKK